MNNKFNHLIIPSRSNGKTNYIKLQLEEIANSRRSDFIKDLEDEIKGALDSNFSAIQRRKMVLSTRDANPFEDPFHELVRGKIEALRGILDYIEEQKKRFTYNDNDPEYKGGAE